MSEHGKPARVVGALEPRRHDRACRVTPGPHRRLHPRKARRCPGSTPWAAVKGILARGCVIRDLYKTGHLPSRAQREHCRSRWACEPVDDRGGEAGVGEGLTPLRERWRRPPRMPARSGGPGRAVRLRAGRGGRSRTRRGRADRAGRSGRPGARACARRRLRPVRSRARPPSCSAPAAALAGGHAEADQQVRLAGAAVAEQHDGLARGAAALQPWSGRPWAPPPGRSRRGA